MPIWKMHHIIQASSCAVTAAAEVSIFGVQLPDGEAEARGKLSRLIQGTQPRSQSASQLAGAAQAQSYGTHISSGICWASYPACATSGCGCLEQWRYLLAAPLVPHAAAFEIVRLVMLYDIADSVAAFLTTPSTWGPPSSFEFPSHVVASRICAAAARRSLMAARVSRVRISIRVASGEAQCEAIMEANPNWTPERMFVVVFFAVCCCFALLFAAQSRLSGFQSLPIKDLVSRSFGAMAQSLLCEAFRLYDFQTRKYQVCRGLSPSGLTTTCNSNLAAAARPRQCIEKGLLEALRCLQLSSERRVLREELRRSLERDLRVLYLR